MTGRGRFIAFEGGESCGKTTQSRMLCDVLGGVLTREPGGTAIGSRIRTVLLDPAHGEMDDRAEAMLMAADRAQHIAEVVRPGLEAGVDVVSDRSAFSSLAYQSYGRGLPLAEVEQLSDWASQGVWPDVVVLLAVPPEIAVARVTQQPDRLEDAGVPFHARVAAGFAALAAADPGRWLIVDGVGEVEAVHERVVTAFRGWEHRRG